MKLFKIFYIFILFFNSSLFAGLNTIEQNDLIIKKNEDSIIEKHDSNQKILIDSLVYPFEQEVSTEGFKKLGNFLYKLNATENSNEYVNDVNEDRKIFKLVEIGRGKYMIADGSFIIEFQGNTDRQKFNEEYSTLISTLPSDISGVSNSFIEPEKVPSFSSTKYALYFI